VGFLLQRDAAIDRRLWRTGVLFVGGASHRFGGDAPVISGEEAK